MAKHATLDANVLLRLVLNNVPDQSRAVLRLLSSGTTFDVPDMIIAEVVYVLQGEGLNRQEIAEAVERIINDSQMNCNTTLFRQALALYVNRPALSFVDCCAAYYAQINNAEPLYTFDKKLVKQSGGLAKLIA